MITTWKRLHWRRLQHRHLSAKVELYIFKTGIHCSPVAYLIQYRSVQAAEQLYITQKSVSSLQKKPDLSSAISAGSFRQHHHMSQMNTEREENRGNFLISTFCNHTIFGDDVVFRYIICINYADNILFMHHIYNVQKIKVFYMQMDRFIYFIYLFAILIITPCIPPAFYIPPDCNIYQLHE